MVYFLHERAVGLQPREGLRQPVRSWRVVPLVIANPINTSVSRALGAATAPGLVQPRLAGLEEVVSPAAQPTQHVGERLTTDRAERAASADRRTRRRYWSVRDLSRRIWVGRGYELLRELIRSGILPATRSARSWWVDDEDAAALVSAFEDRAGKVRAFRGLDAWLRERCYVAPLTPEVETLTRLTHSGFAWRGQVYLPRTSWTVETGPDGAAEYRHRSGAVIEGTDPQTLAA